MELVYELRTVVAKFIASVAQISESAFYDYGITLGFKQRPGGKIMLAELALPQGQSLSIQLDPKAHSYKVRVPIHKRNRDEKGKKLESLIEVRTDAELKEVLLDRYVPFMDQTRNDLMRRRERRNRSGDNRAAMENLFSSILLKRKLSYADSVVEFTDGPFAGLEITWKAYQDTMFVPFDDDGRIELELKHGVLKLSFMYNSRHVFHRKARSTKAIRPIIETGIVDVRKQISSKAV